MVSSRAFVEFILLGPLDDRRQLQDSPILGDVWIAFASNPGTPRDLLITPYWKCSAGRIASQLNNRLVKLGFPGPKIDARVAYLQGIVAARLYFRDLLRVVVPMTEWWQLRGILKKLKDYTEELLQQNLQAFADWVKAVEASAPPDEQQRLVAKLARLPSLDRYAALAALILAAESEKSAGIVELIQQSDAVEKAAKKAADFFNVIAKDEALKAPQVFQVALNRNATPALSKSVPAIKADAARTLFNVNCSEIAWAVIDSGIDGNHHAFKDADGKPRILQSYDFSRIRQIVSLDNREPAKRQAVLSALPTTRRADVTDSDKDEALRLLAEDADNDRAINWEWVEKLVEIDPTESPPSKHGTHVAGIIGANAKAFNKGVKAESKANATTDKKSGKASKSRKEEANKVTESFEGADGVCPDIKLYDIRVLSSTLEDTEFAVIAALQFVRFLNDRHSYMSIHGVNLSLSIPHDVRNYACGRTPVCEECERLVGSGVVVVAAAGNRGYQSFETREGSVEGYTAFSITDPGNADGVITVGATHRFSPHTYGVSFFSSRGPTGDGRMKPDLVAPGERVEAPLLDNTWGQLDGTSMAAPHVSGAAAMLMARYSEMIAQPRRIKRILCESATNLERERSFQGNGMLDVLRAFQSV